MKNEAGEKTIYKDLSLNDIFGFMNQPSNRHWGAAVDTLVFNQEQNERLNKEFCPNIDHTL